MLKLCSLVLLFASSISSKNALGPYQGLRSKDTPHFQDPSCVWFTLQVSESYPQVCGNLSDSKDNLPAETVQLITYGAPEMSAYLAMSLMGR